MYQSPKLILWKNAEPIAMTNEEITDLLYKIFCLLKDYGEELNPKYETVWRKKDATPFIFSKTNLGALIDKTIKEDKEKEENEEYEKYFPDFGVRVGFFSSLNNKKASGIRCTLGCYNPRFKNTIVIDLPSHKFSGFYKRKEEFVVLFKKLIKEFQPYFAFVCSNKNESLGEGYWKNKPTHVHWLNYYSNDTINIIGKKRFESLPDIERDENGCFLRLQEDPIDIENPDHLKLQEKVSKQLGLV
jgi:hypothetical protein